MPVIRLHRPDWRTDWSFSWAHLRVGMPMAFQFSITAIGVMVIQGALNTFGSVKVAAFTAASKIHQLAVQPLNSLGITMATYAAQNFGAGKIERVRIGVRKSTRPVSYTHLNNIFGTEGISRFFFKLF